MDINHRSAESILEGIQDFLNDLAYSARAGGQREHAFNLHIDKAVLEAIEEQLGEMAYAIQDDAA